MSGRRIVLVTWVVTVVFAVSVVVAVAFPATEAVAIVVSLVAFFVGSGVALFAFALGIIRSARGDDVTVANLFLLQGSPRPVRRQFLLVLAVSLGAVALSFANRAIAPFAWLELMVVVGAPALWAARHGAFPARADRTAPPG